MNVPFFSVVFFSKTLLTIALSAGVTGALVHADEAGKAAYAACSACHRADGQGLAIGDKKMAPSLAGSKIVNGDPSVLALVILKGVKKEGNEYMGMMAPLERAYKEDQKLADLLNYVRSSFGNKAGAVTVEDAAAFRAKWSERKKEVTRAELSELVK